MGLADRVEQALIDRTDHERAPDTWYAVDGQAEPVLRGRWLDDSHRWRYQDVTAPPAVATAVTERLEAVRERVEIDLDTFPQSRYERDDIVVDERAVSLRPGGPSEGDSIGKVRYAVDAPFHHEAAREEAAELAAAVAKGGGATLGDARGRFDAGVLTEIAITADNRRVVRVPDELSTPQLPRLWEEAVERYTAAVRSDGTHRTETTSLTLAKLGDDETFRLRERAGFTVVVSR